METLKKTDYTFSNDLGDATITVYDVFPGVQLAYHSVHMDRLDLAGAAEGPMIEIHHCREGRIEQEFEDCYFYLMPGDLSIARRNSMVGAYKFPLRHYHGITIGIHTGMVSQHFYEFLHAAQVEPREVVQRLCGQDPCFIIRGEKYIEHLFAELYAVPERIQPGYFKVKIWELLLVLSGLDMQTNRVKESTLSKSQVQVANQVAAYLQEHMEQPLTIAQLAKRFNISESHLKTVFKGVYGVAISSYNRIQKMQAAAQRLIHTDLPVAEIAGELGYTNPGKFATAFQKVMGETPSEYRRAHTKS